MIVLPLLLDVCIPCQFSASAGHGGGGGASQPG